MDTSDTKFKISSFVMEDGDAVETCLSWNDIELSDIVALQKITEKNINEFVSILNFGIKRNNNNEEIWGSIKSSFDKEISTCISENEDKWVSFKNKWNMENPALKLLFYLIENPRLKNESMDWKVAYDMMIFSGIFDNIHVCHFFASPENAKIDLKKRLIDISKTFPKKLQDLIFFLLLIVREETNYFIPSKKVELDTDLNKYV